MPLDPTLVGLLAPRLQEAISIVSLWASSFDSP